MSYCKYRLLWLTNCRHTWETFRTDLDYNGNTVNFDEEGKMIEWPLKHDTEKHMVEHGFPRFRIQYHKLLEHQDRQKLAYIHEYPEPKKSSFLGLVLALFSLPKLILHGAIHLLSCSRHHHDHSLKPTRYVGKTYLEMLMAPRFGRGPLKGSCLCWPVQPNRFINLDAGWAGVAASLSYLFAGLCTLLPYLAHRPLWMCVVFSGAVSMVAVVAFGMFKGFQEMTWRSCAGRTEHGFIEICVLAITAICSGGAAIGLVLAFDHLPTDTFDY